MRSIQIKKLNKTSKKTINNMYIFELKPTIGVVLKSKFKV